MARFLHGDRVARLGKLVIGCSAVIRDPSGERVLLTRRSDNGRWCLPGGQMETGESASEACAREVLEETALTVRIGRLIALDSDPHRLLEYADGNRYHVVGLCFEAVLLAGEPALSDETTAIRWVSFAELDEFDIIEHHRQYIADALADLPAPAIR